MNRLLGNCSQLNTTIKECAGKTLQKKAECSNYSSQLTRKKNSTALI